MRIKKNDVANFRTRRDELIIRGKVYGECIGVKPAVILCHGFIANQTMCKKYAVCLSKLGYVCFTFDFCGGGLFNSSDGKTTDMSIFSEIDDLEAVVKYVGELDYIDKSRISLLGCSQGGVVSAMFAKKRPQVIDKLLLFYPALCIPDDARRGRMMFAKFDPNQIPDKLWCGPMRLGKCYVQTVKDLNIFSEIGSFKGKVFFVHGIEDRIVDISYSRKAKGLYSDIEYHEIANGGHGFKGKCDVKVLKLLEEFMN